MSKTNTARITLATIGEYRIWNGVYFTASGKAYRTVGTELQEIGGSRIGAKGHVIMTVAGRTIYLARMIYCLFNDMDYDAFTGRIKYINGDYSNCAYSNIACESKPERVSTVKRQDVDSWAVRQMFCVGQQPTQIAETFGINLQRVRAICLGFENVGIEQMEQIRRIAAPMQAEK